MPALAHKLCLRWRISWHSPNVPPSPHHSFLLKRPLLGAFQSSMTRSEYFAALCIVGIINGVGPKITQAIAHDGLIDAALIKREVPDYKERTFYISGPRTMVLHFRGALRELGVGRSRIKEDFFPGFA